MSEYAEGLPEVGSIVLRDSEAWGLTHSFKSLVPVIIWLEVFCGLEKLEEFPLGRAVDLKLQRRCHSVPWSPCPQPEIHVHPLQRCGWSPSSVLVHIFLHTS